MSLIDRARMLRRKIEAMATELPDSEALENVELYPRWKSGHLYSVDERISYEGRLYRCVQAHTSEDNWTPDQTPALWTRVSVEEWPEWIQPSGAQDAYNKGDKVSYDSKHWISDIDGNVWQPGVYGWTES